MREIGRFEIYVVNMLKLAYDDNEWTKKIYNRLSLNKL